MAVVLITGANRGIGLALVRSLAMRGDRILATCRNPGDAEELRALAASPGLDIRVARMDVSSPASIAESRAEIGDGAIDVLVNNAGVMGPRRQSTLDMDFEGWIRAFEINTISPLRVVQTFLPNLRKAPAARILTVSSRMGSLAYNRSDRMAYRSSKAAVNKVMQGLATDLRGEGIAVSVVHPGWVATDMGGNSADLSPDVSAAGIVRVIDKMRALDSPRFYNYDGSELPW
ncbi:SDR family oxidoreductase [Prosthecomicrobium sp. N25]|uniref:SDR family oxidoreductase n=1 Tax=Prosthecomicrobium sp. N25 TaxID=3129254 RepID=UPI003076BCDE